MSEASQRGRSRSKYFDRSSQPSSRSNQQAQSSLEEQLAAFRLVREDSIPTFPSVQPRESGSEKSIDFPRRDSIKSSDDLGPFDITQPNPTIELSPHLRFFLDFDWGATELGPVNTWSIELRRMINFLMNDPRAAALYWGESRTIIYNEPYVLATGQRHPGMMGKTFAEAWFEVEGDFTPAFEKAAETGVSYTVDDARFYIERHGYLEETYYSISIIPFSANDGNVAFYNPVIDTTRQVITDRRMAFLLRLGQYISSSREPKEFWQQLLHGLEPDHLDLPFALLYSAGWDVNENLSETSEVSHGSRSWNLEGLIRVSEGPSIIPARLSSDEDMSHFLPDLPELLKEDSSKVLRTADKTLPKAVADNLQANSGDFSYDSAVLLPIRSTGDTTLGFLILGINPRKRFDEDYKVFIGLLSRQLTTSMAAAVLFEDEIRRGRLAAEEADRDRNLLSRKLAIQTHEALEIESRFRRMADLAPVGMFHIDPAGVLIYANNDYYALTEHPRDVSYPMSWYNVIHTEDHGIVDREWAKLLQGDNVSFELRLRRPWVADEVVAGEKAEGSTWIIAAAYAEKAEDDTVLGVLGCITDISRQKWTEGFQKRKMLEAVELKRQQESFIDMTSHEMRNPLSAIIQCADWIGDSLAEFNTGNKKDVVIPREIIDGYADAASTIILCAQHQKRIIDDILTLSKLDSDLLFITPVEVQPTSVIENALKMFDGELQKSDIELRFRIEPSYEQLTIDWVKLDPSRLLQVFINLITNAIKFTQLEPKRKIQVIMGASLEKPQSNQELEYLPRSGNHKDETLGTNSGSGEMLYVSVEVQDSGRGLDEQEKHMLFKRFSQASPKTHVQYGGSGLGLFISRRLTEVQGGQIGVASKAGIGSTFAFYVRARRCSPPDNPSPVSKLKNIDLRAQTRILGPTAIERIKNPGVGKSDTKKAADAPVGLKYVLVVEDNIINQKVLSKQLKSAGCIVSVANHGLEALEFLEKSRFWVGKQTNGEHLSIVLMDLEMPVMDGLTCVKKIRELQQEGKLIGHVPVIAVTANARSEQIATAKECGMDSVVTKPFRIPELLPVMERQLRLKERPAVGERSSSAPAP
ncbi:putative histidine kinase M3YPp [Tricladium varicosporioides]|nr:putative histidine kinase M3YPp [Hymenoscyphus varicosporioides]